MNTQKTEISQAELAGWFFCEIPKVCQTSQNVIKRTFVHVCLMNTQISMHIFALIRVSLSALNKFACMAVQTPPIYDSDQAARMRRLTRIFIGRTDPKERFLTMMPASEKSLQYGCFCIDA